MTIEHTTRAHARLSASRADRFINCPGSVALENKMPYEPPGEAAAIGTAIHELSEAMIRGDALIQEDYPDEQWDMAAEYAAWIKDMAQGATKTMIEVNVDDGLKSIHPALGGTADAVIIKDRTLHVIDLKTGRVPVKADNNLQLLTYATGVARMLKAPADVKVVLHIYQPRTGHSSWETDGNRLINHGNDLKKAAELIDQGDAPTNPGQSQCKYCRAKSICPSMLAKAAEAARSDFQPQAKAKTKPSQEVIVDDQLLELAMQMQDWSSAVIDHAKRIISDGGEVPGWTLKQGRKMRFWSAPAMVEEALRDVPEAWELKSVAAITKLNIDLPEGLIGEKISAPSLARAK